jgi:hypothetical protein
MAFDDKEFKFEKGTFKLVPPIKTGKMWLAKNSVGMFYEVRKIEPSLVKKWILITEISDWAHLLPVTNILN